MLEAICRLLRGLGSDDDGVESQLSAEAMNGIVDLIRTVYGDYPADTIAQFFVRHGDAYVCFDEAEAALRNCLQGRGD